MLKCFWADIALLEEAELFEFWLEKVKIQRKEKVLRCKNQKDRMRSLMAGVLLYQVLAEEGLNYEEIEFSVTEEGKPYMLSHPQLHFSISHAGDVVCCLLSDEIVGVDVECKNKSIFSSEKKNRLQTMARKCLSDAEWQTFDKCEEKYRVFLEFWTRKEAYSKALGKGLGMDFSRIDTETNKKKYWTKWMLEEYCISIYGQKEDYEELFVKQIISL